MSELFTTVRDDQTLLNGIRTALGVSGVAALLFGVLILVWPGHTAAAVVAVFIIAWAGISGLVNLSIGVFSRNLGAKPRVGYLLLGVLFVAAAVVAWINLSMVTHALAVLIGILVGVVWVIEGVVVLVSGLGGTLRLWPTVYAAISIVAGVLMISSPLWGATLLWLLLGCSLVVLGVVQIIRAFRFGR